ncbi:hypothetical protein BLNAU_13166 [Blattamonas nauphoetae]|uniref:Uncharacterized protein n=1 Tax=Blattamonas nauphoetae TaxID=2049346 RepID=A0ABQ9XKB8_9EUKA|nr:hypothetical protein BLNAU_13166 [Blattamonas nauphoetae]
MYSFGDNIESDQDTVLTISNVLRSSLFRLLLSAIQYAKNRPDNKSLLTLDDFCICFRKNTQKIHRLKEYFSWKSVRKSNQDSDSQTSQMITSQQSTDTFDDFEESFPDSLLKEATKPSNKRKHVKTSPPTPMSLFGFDSTSIVNARCFYHIQNNTLPQSSPFFLSAYRIPFNFTLVPSSETITKSMTQSEYALFSQSREGTFAQTNPAKFLEWVTGLGAKKQAKGYTLPAPLNFTLGPNCIDLMSFIAWELVGIITIAALDVRRAHSLHLNFPDPNDRSNDSEQFQAKPLGIDRWWNTGSSRKDALALRQSTSKLKSLSDLVVPTVGLASTGTGVIGSDILRCVDTALPIVTEHVEEELFTFERHAPMNNGLFARSFRPIKTDIAALYDVVNKAADKNIVTTKDGGEKMVKTETTWALKPTLMTSSFQPLPRHDYRSFPLPGDQMNRGQPGGPAKPALPSPAPIAFRQVFEKDGHAKRCRAADLHAQRRLQPPPELPSPTQLIPRPNVRPLPPLKRRYSLPFLHHITELSAQIPLQIHYHPSSTMSLAIHYHKLLWSPIPLTAQFVKEGVERLLASGKELYEF